MLYFNYNGKIFSAGTGVIGPDNRGLRYGDGLFETIKYSDGRLILLDEHFARLWKGLQLMQFHIPKHLTADILQQQILQLLAKNNHSIGKVRITVIRGNGGLYDPKNHLPEFFIQSWPLMKNFSLNENGLQLCIYPGAKKSIDLFSNLKHNNFLPYLMGALYAKEQHCNDAIILNSHGRLADTTIANLFLVKNGIIHTASTEEGCVAGIMRKFIIRELSEAGYKIIESPLEPGELAIADEVFITNSIFNLRWVAAIDNTKYTHEIISAIYTRLRQTNPMVFC